jgi:hypothetical protein
LAKLYGSSNTTAADLHTTAAASLKAGILDLLWDSEKVRCYSFFLSFFFGNQYSIYITDFRIHLYISLRFMISSSIPTIAAMYFPLPHFILSGVVLSRTKLPMTKNLLLELLHLSIW